MSGNGIRICIVAEHASTRFGGEAILPYHYFRVLRTRGLDAWLIVHERTGDELLELFPEDAGRLRFVQDMALQKLFFRLGKLLPRRISEATFGLANQLLTQFAQRGIVRALRTNRTVVHQPIPVSPRFPSLLAGAGAPLVIGPLNGGMDYPSVFRSNESLASRAAIALGRSFSDFANFIVPGKRRAAVVLVANERTRAALPSGLKGRVIELPENGVDLDRWAVKRAAESTRVSTSFLFIGRLVDWKALDVAMAALAFVPGASLDVIGDGPMLEAWRSMAGDLGVGDRVRFHGWLSQEECATRLGLSCALVLPSVYECGGAAVLEAMAMAKPVIATAWGGPADYLDESCGILVAPTSHAEMVAQFAEGMKLLLESPERCARLGAAGRAKVLEHFDWEKKVDRMLEIYATALVDGKAESTNRDSG